MSHQPDPTSVVIITDVNVSGGHINPAVSAAMVCLRKLPLRKLPVYALAQYLGGFVASLFIWLIYMGKGLGQKASKPGKFSSQGSGAV